MSQSDLLPIVRNSMLVVWMLVASGCGRSKVVSPEPAPEGAQQAAEVTVDPLSEAQLGSTPNLHRSGAIWLAGQPSSDDLAAAQSEGIQTVVTLRQDGEIDWDEAAAAQESGLEYVAIPFRGAENLTDEIFQQVRQILGQSSQKPVLLHCATANRVGAVWLPYRVLDQGVDLEQAIQEARQVGLRDEAYEQRAREYIQKHLSAEP